MAVPERRNPERVELCVFCGRHPVERAWRPFCSGRCRLQDLARWADESYRVPGEAVEAIEPIEPADGAGQADSAERAPEPPVEKVTDPDG